MRSAAVATAVVMFCLPATSSAQVELEEDYIVKVACPTGLASSFPQGSTETICLWIITDCPTGTTGSMFGACAGAACNCVGVECSGDNFLDPSGTGVIDDDPSTDPGDGGEGEGDGPPPPPEGGPGVELDMPDNSKPIRTVSAASHILTSTVAIQAETRKKVFVSNKKDLKRITPISSKLVPATAGAITDFGQGDYKTKYLKALKLKVGSADEYYALYKVFKNNAGNANGDQDLAADHYVGIRMSQPPTEPPGGYATLNANAGGRFKKLGKFESVSGTGHVREAAVRLPIKRGVKGTPMTWFHLFGTVM